MVLEPPELALDSGAAPVEALPLVALTGQVGLTDAAVATERDHGGHVAVGALGVDAAVVVAHVHRAGHRLAMHAKGTGTASGKVDLYATTNRPTLTKLVATQTLKSGAATFKVKPTQNTTYSAKLEQGSSYAPSTSHGVNVAVVPVLSVATRPGGRMQLHGRRGSKTLLNAKMRPKIGETLGFTIQRQVGAGWRTDLRSTFLINGSDGTVHAFFFTTRTARFRVRVSYRGDTNFTSSKSAWKKFHTRGGG